MTPTLPHPNDPSPSPNATIFQMTLTLHQPWPFANDLFLADPNPTTPWPYHDLNHDLMPYRPEYTDFRPAVHFSVNQLGKIYFIE